MIVSSSLCVAHIIEILEGKALKKLEGQVKLEQSFKVSSRYRSFSK